MPKGVYQKTAQHGENISRSLRGLPLIGPAPSFATAHKRVVTLRGNAREHDCIDCDKIAYDWSYKHPVGFSDDPLDYEPRCRGCHQKYDRTLLADCWVWALERGYAA